MNTRLHVVILVFIFLVAFLLRFYKLGEVPNGLYQDETAIGYNAYSITETGRDEHGESYPLYFKSFGDYKLPVYIYSTIIPVQLFGLNEFAVRFSSALFGFLTVIVFYFFVKEITKNKVLAVLATASLAINPWHLHYSRATFEVSIGLFLFILGGLLLHYAFTKQIKGAFLLGTLCFIVSLYSYNLTRLLAPALYILFLLLYRKGATKVAKPEMMTTGAFAIISLIPFMITLFQSGGVSSAGGTLIFSSAVVQSPFIELRSYLAEFSTIFVKPFFNLPMLTLWKYIENIASYLSTQFFFISGSLHGNHGIGNVGQFYLFELPFFLLGIITLVKQKLRWGSMIMLWVAVVVLVASLTREVPHATRSFFLLPGMLICTAFGIYTFYNRIARIRTVSLKTFILTPLLLFVIYNIVFYFTSYYVRFPILYAKSWRMADKPLSLFLREEQNKYDKIIVDKEAGFMYTSLLFYSHYLPSEFQKTVIWEEDDSEGFSFPKSFGKYEFREIDWGKDYPKPRTLYITTHDRKPNEVSPLKTFYYPKRPVVFSVKQGIIQYPVEDIAYVVVESK